MGLSVRKARDQVADVLDKVQKAIPDGPLGTAVRLTLLAAAAFWWTSGSGAQEAR
jgi:hypothetical protein